MKNARNLILIVEDDPVITETLCAYMGRWGMEARGVEDFQNVLREFAAFDPQLVLMDILRIPYQIPLIFQVHLLSFLLLHQLSYL